MPVMSNEDIAYRVARLKDAWDQDRALTGDPVARIERVTVTGENAALGVEGSETASAGFPALIPVYVRPFTQKELTEAAGMLLHEDRELTIFDTSASRAANEYIPNSLDRIYLDGERWHYKSFTRNPKTKIIHAVISPLAVTR